MTTVNTPYDNLDKHLSPLAGSRPGLQLAEINPRGPSRALWFLEHVLPLIGDNYNAIGEVDERFRRALAPMAEKVDVWEGPPAWLVHVLVDCTLIGPERLDVIYLNRHRNDAAMLSLIEAAWVCLRPGGVLVVEEYRTHRRRYQYIGRLVDRFLAKHEHEVMFQSNEKGVRKPA